MSAQMSIALQAALRVAAFTVGAVVTAALLLLGGAGQQQSSVEPTAVTTTQADRVADLLGEHDCWTAEAPPDVEVPGHVVVVDDLGQVIYGGPKYVDQALRQVFEDADYGLTVAAFCR